MRDFISAQDRLGFKPILAPAARKFKTKFLNELIYSFIGFGMIYYVLIELSTMGAIQ